MESSCGEKTLLKISTLSPPRWWMVWSSLSSHSYCFKPSRPYGQSVESVKCTQYPLSLWVCHFQLVVWNGRNPCSFLGFILRESIHGHTVLRTTWLFRWIVGFTSVYTAFFPMVEHEHFSKLRHRPNRPEVYVQNLGYLPQWRPGIYPNVGKER